MYFDTPKKNNRKNRSTSKAKIPNVNNSSEKIIQKDKENNYANIKNGGTSNVNHNSGKFFFVKNKKFSSGSNGQANAANGIYPSNYGLYLSNSSLFSKLGNDIISSNGKINPSQVKNKINVNNILPNQSIKNLKAQNNLGSQINGINPNGIVPLILKFFKLRL